MEDVAATPSRVAAFSDAYSFDPLPEMVATADVVILATVEEVPAPRDDGPPGDEIPVADVLVRVEEALKGTTDREVLTIYTDALDPYGLDWRIPGTRVVLFLFAGKPAGTFYQVNRQSIFVVEADRLKRAYPDPFADQVSALSLAELRREVAVANDLIAKGAVAPQPPLGGAAVDTARESP